jgi:hypothetical protein
MGCMSASDAAPLPRLGEVFFDVRGESRTMRLSWYADTGVAVFSIWQGGTCTGTFRLPIPDLPRMVEALQRGPGDQHRPPTVPAQRGPARPARPDPLADGIETGQTTAAVHVPAAEPDVTGYLGEPPDAHPDPGYITGPPGYPAGLAEPAGEFTAGYAAEPGVDFAAEPGPRHSRTPTRRYPGEPGAAAYADEPADGYLGDDTVLAPGYAGDDQAGPLGTEPAGYDRPRRGRRRREPGYADEPDDYQPYPGELPATEYESPVRPYVTDEGDTDEPFAEDDRRAGPSPDSFPYGPPPTGDEPRQRGRYPGRD